MPKLSLLPQIQTYLSKDWLLPKLFYLTYFGAMSSMGPYLGLYYHQLGLDGAQIGLLTALPSLITMVAAPLWSAIADATRRHKLILIGAVLGTLASIVALISAQTFALLIPVISVYALFLAPVMPLVDNAILGMLERKSDYGPQRVLGAFGPALSGPIVTAWAAQIGMNASFYSFIGCFCCVLGVVAGLNYTTATKVGKHAPNVSFWQGVRVLIGDLRFVFFLFIAFLGMMSRSTSFSYLFLYMDELGAPQTMMGLTMTVLAIGDIPFLFFSGYLLRRWGARGLILASLAASAIMLFTFGWMRAPWLAVVAHLAHGFSYSGLYIAGVSFAGEMAPPGLGATAQGLFSAVASGLGIACGAFFGGLLYDSIGGAGLFRCAGGVVLAALLMYVLIGGKRRSCPSPVPLS